MNIQIGVVMNPMDSLAAYKDTTVGIILAAETCGFKVWHINPQDLYGVQGRTHASMRPLHITDATGSKPDWYQLDEVRDCPLAELDAVLMRLDPPFNMNYIYNTYLLEAAQQEGLLVINDPRSLRDCNEKFFASQFPEVSPPNLISASLERIKAFHSEHGACVVKPLDGMGGEGVFKLIPDEHNTSALLEHLTQWGQTPIVIQKFIKEIDKGDKRLLMVDGEAVQAVLVRIAAPGEVRANLAAGGSASGRDASARDLEIAAVVGPELKKRGIVFAGLDIIGDSLTEINVTSPTGARELKEFCGVDACALLMDVILKKLESSG